MTRNHSLKPENYLTDLAKLHDFEAPHNYCYSKPRDLKHLRSGELLRVPLDHGRIYLALPAGSALSIH